MGNVDALGNTTSNLYNANNQLITKIDELGRRWSFTRDPLNRVIAETDPLGNTRQTSFDAAGRVRQVISARGFPESNLYDGRGRLTRWTDADGSVWTYLYDGNANITKITDALGGEYRMTYGPRNERLTETNQDGDTWLYRYNALLQLDTQTDPRGIIRTNLYDAANKLTNVLYSTGRNDTFVLDLNGNRTEMTRLYPTTDPVTLRFNYDSLDRPTNQFDSVTFLAVGYEWDARGQLTRLIYPGGNGGRPLEKTYDLLGRLTNQVFRFGPGQSFTNYLSYDRADRLVQHIYPNGVTRTNGFDESGRLSGMAYLTNAAPFLRWQFGYDNDGNRTLSAEQGTVDFPLPPLTDERATNTPAGKLIHRQITSLTATNTPLNTVTQLFRYDVSGNLTNQTGGGPTIQFEDDEADLERRSDHCGDRESLRRAGPPRAAPAQRPDHPLRPRSLRQHGKHPLRTAHRQRHRELLRPRRHSLLQGGPYRPGELLPRGRLSKCGGDDLRHAASDSAEGLHAVWPNAGGE